MKAFLGRIWSNVVESFWFVPALMSVTAVIGSIFLIALDRNGDWASVALVWSGGASGARSLLSTVATSMITVAGTVFSITIAALTLASQQFGPRLLRNFTVDRGNQIVLGTFVSTFLYCLMILRTIRGQNEGQFVPNLSVSIAVLLACASLCVLIYFIHHLSSSIQAENLLASVGGDLRDDLQRLSPPAPTAPGDREPEKALPRRAPQPIVSAGSGYIQRIDREELVSIAEEADLLLQLPLRPGDFVSVGETLIEGWTGEPHAEIDDAVKGRLRDTIQLGERRTPWQDARYGVRQLTEIGARALSPGTNDPFTAMGCLDWLIDALGELAGRKAPTGIAFGSNGNMRLVEQPVTFAELLALGIDPFREYGGNSVILACHMMQLLGRLARRASHEEHRQAVLHEARSALDFAENNLPSEADRMRVREGFKSVEAVIEGSAP